MLDLAEETAALPSAAALPRDAAGLLLWCRGAVRVALGRVDEAVPLLRELVALARQLDDRLLLAHALTSLGLSVPVETSTEEAKALLGEGLALYRAAGDAWGTVFALLPLGQVTLRDGDAGTAMDLHREALARAEEIDSDHLRAQAFAQLGLDALLLGEIDAGRDWFALSADVQRRLFDHEGLAYCLDGFSSVALLRGQLELAAQLGGAADATRTRIGVAVWPLLRPLSQALMARLEEALGPEAFARERASGAALRPYAALDYALASTR
jgi:tetratricopeptide (TPR) repeat protein